MELLIELGVFLAKAIVLVIAIVITVASIVAVVSRSKTERGELAIKNMSEQLADMTEYLNSQVLDKKAFKRYQKQQKSVKKTNSNTSAHSYVIHFKGSLDAHEVASLREEVSAVLVIAKPQDEVIVTIESGGGMVHGYGLAASQLARIREANIPLTVCIDKVAASGGYMMACVANTIVAAPFAIVGSIGVIAQIPNFNKVLKKHDVDFEQHTAGTFKRTLTMFGENTDDARQKFKQELEQTHDLFKQFVQRYRSQLEIETVATGEHWFGQQALDLNLIDDLKTSDDWIQQRALNRKVFEVKYKIKQSLTDKLNKSAAIMVKNLIQQLTHR
ncbi:MAG: protease SohB [Shewanellaceae bacterium]|nr:protease SohB [Shewanellaceae bacterium]